jgi:hypothetical protein
VSIKKYEFAVFEPDFQDANCRECCLSGLAVPGELLTAGTAREAAAEYIHKTYDKTDRIGTVYVFNPATREMHTLPFRQVVKTELEI